MAETLDTESQPGGEADPGGALAGRGLLLVLSLAALVVALDQATKAWAVHALGDRPPGQERVDLIGDLFGLHLARNPGAAFSFATGSTWIFTVLAVVVALAIVRLARRLRSLIWGLALGFLLGGALGNLTDRLFREPGFGRGHVVDFLELPHWPIFNLADSSICLSAGLIVLASLRGIGIDGRIDAPIDNRPVER
jgi:signal peptidase II